MALYLSNEGHLDLQHFFLKWAPGVPPYHVRCRLLGLADPVDDNSSSSDGDISIDTSYSTSTSSCSSDVSLPAPEPCFAPNVSSSIASRSSAPIWASLLGIFSKRSDWRWSLEEDSNAAATGSPQSIIGRNDAREAQASLEESVDGIEGGFQPETPESSLGLNITTMDDALRSIQEIKSFSDIHPVIDAITIWAATASSFQLREFNDACEVYPHTMWMRPYFPQLEYSELVTILPYLKQDYKVDVRRSAPYINLEAAHLLGMVWSMLYLRNIITAETYTDGIAILWENQDYARCDILDTILTTLIDGYVPGKVDIENVLNIVGYRDDVRAAKLYHLAQIT